MVDLKAYRDTRTHNTFRRMYTLLGGQLFSAICSSKAFGSIMVCPDGGHTSDSTVMLRGSSIADSCKVCSLSSYETKPSSSRSQILGQEVVTGKIEAGSAHDSTSFPLQAERERHVVKKGAVGTYCQSTVKPRRLEMAVISRESFFVTSCTAPQSGQERRI